MTYSDKLKDPKWQRKRLEIMARDYFTCKMCGGKDDTLHVHHRHYINGREPWDYPDQLLVTLCHVCHKKEEDCADKANEILNNLHFWGFFNTEILAKMNEMIESKLKNFTAYADKNAEGLDTE